MVFAWDMNCMTVHKYLPSIFSTDTNTLVFCGLRKLSYVMH